MLATGVSVLGAAHREGLCQQKTGDPAPGSVPSLTPHPTWHCPRARRAAWVLSPPCKPGRIVLAGLCHPVRVGPVDTTPLGFGRHCSPHPSSWPGPSSPAEGHICVSQGVMVLSGPGVLSEDPPGPVRESREVLTILPNRSGGRGSKALLGLSCGGSLGWLSSRTGWRLHSLYQTVLTTLPLRPCTGRSLGSPGHPGLCLAALGPGLWG